MANGRDLRIPEFPQFSTTDVTAADLLIGCDVETNRTKAIRFDALGIALNPAFNPKWYGAKGDGRTISDGVVTNGSPTLMSATAAFTSADVGKLIHVLLDSTTGARLRTTIIGYTNASTVTMGTNSTATGSSKRFSYGTDDLVALQACFDAAAATTAAGANSHAARMVVPRGRYMISDTWKLGYGAGYTACVVEGGCGSPEDIDAVCIDACTLTDRPAINIQGAYSTILDGFTVVGGNRAPVSLAIAQTNTEADWISSGLASSRYAPYAGICIDAYCGTAPGTAYPNDAYSRSPSTGVTLKNCFVSGFVVNYCIKPSDDDNNCENLQIERCTSTYGTYALSVGNSQARAIQVSSFAAYGHRWSVTCRSHGKQQGTMPHFLTPNFGGCWRLFTAATLNGQGSVENGHFEEYAEIVYGTSGLAGLNLPLKFTACQFSLGPFVRPPVAGKLSMVPVLAGGPIHFDCCTFADSGSPYGVFNVAGSNINTLVKFTSCSFLFSQGGWADHPYVCLALNANMCMPIFENCKVITAEAGISGTAGMQMLNTMRMEQQTGSTRLYSSPFSKFHMSALGGTLALKSGAGNCYVAVAYTSHVWNTTTQVDITVPTISDLAVNDILMWQTVVLEAAGAAILPGLKITAINGSVASCTALFDASYYDRTWTPTIVYLCPREYVTAGTVTGDVTNGTNTILNVANATNIFAVRDIIKGTGIPTTSRVTSVVGTTVTMSKNNTATNAGVTLTYGTKATVI